MSAPIAIDDRTEWLEADGLGGFASGTTSGIRTRRYHALLLAATTPPTGRMVLVNGLDAWIERPGEPAEYLTRQRYAPGIVAPENGAVLEAFADEPWPTWSWRLRDGIDRGAGALRAARHAGGRDPLAPDRRRRRGRSWCARSSRAGTPTRCITRIPPSGSTPGVTESPSPGSRITACPR